MADSRRRWARLGVLAAAVLGVHAWLLSGIGSPLHRPAANAAAWVVRTVAPAPAVAQPAQPPGPVAAAQAVAREPKRPATTAPVAASVPAPAPLQGPRPAPAATAPLVAAAASAPATAPAPAAARGESQPAATVPPSMVLHYRVVAHARGFDLQGQARLDWRHDGHQYEASLQLSAPLLPSRTQRSSGLVTAEGIAPLRFSDRSRHEEAAHFQRDAGKVSFSGNRPDVPLLPGAQDRLTVMLQLGALLAAAPQRYPAGSTIAIQTASTRDAEPWSFRVEGTESLRLPGGTVEALRLTRRPRHEYDQLIELWLAPGQDYAPVRVRLTQPNGDWVDQQWSSTDRG